jgi:hypothetical protein
MESRSIRAARSLALRALSLLALSLLAQPVPGRAQGAWKGKASSEGGVTTMQNPAEPMLPPTTMQPEPLWRIGGETDAEGEFFGVISDIEIAPNGDVYLLDMQLDELKVFSGGGEYLRTIGRGGEGPGEFRRAGTLFQLENGNVAVMQGFPARAVVLTPQGEPAAPLPLKSPEEGGFRGVFAGAYRGGSLVIQGNSFSMGEGKMERTTALVRIDMQGNELARFQESKVTDTMGNLVIREAQSARMPWSLTPDGRIVVSPDFGYTLQVWKPDGTLERVIKRDYASRKRSPAEIDKQREILGSSIRVRGSGGDLKPKVEVNDHDRDIEWLEVTDDGHIWVLSSRGGRDAPKDALGTFDVFDPQGRFVQQVTLRVDAKFGEDRLLLAGDRLFVVKEFASAQRALFASGDAADADAETDAEPMSVVCYPLQWSPAQVAAPAAGKGK